MTKMWTEDEILALWPQAAGELRGFAYGVLGRLPGPCNFGLANLYPDGHLQRQSGITGGQLVMALQLAQEAFERRQERGRRGPGHLMQDVSDATLKTLFDPAYGMDLNVPLGEHILRMLAAEHLHRGGERTEPLEEALVGPGECRHGRSAALCHECDEEAGRVFGEDDEGPSERDLLRVLSAFCDAYREQRPFNRKALYEALVCLGHGLRKNDPAHDQNAPCAGPGCGHPYERHFDPYEDDREVGCKYCQCGAFVEPAEGVVVQPAEPGGLTVRLAREPRRG